MSATLGTSGINRARLTRPRYGIAVCEALLTDSDAVLPEGSTQTLTIGDYSAPGVVHGGAFGGQAGYTWQAGAGAWSTDCPQRPPYHDDAGVMLSVVAADLARDAGELGCILDGIPDRSLGRDWTRPEAPARDLLDALASAPGQWWVDEATGITHLGPRPAAAFSSPMLGLRYDPSIRRGVAQIADDTIAGLAPGTTLTAIGLAIPLLIASATVEVQGDDIAVVIYGEKTGPELFRAMVDAATAWRAYLGTQPYTVAVASSLLGAPVAVQPSDARSARSPDAPSLSHMPGVPGVSFTLPVGAGIAVAYLAGDPGSPVVCGYLPGVLPGSVMFDASGTIDLGAGADFLAKAAQIVTWAGLVNGALSAAGHPVAALVDPTCAKARGA